MDPLSGRCVYVADTGSQRLSHPVFHARTGEFCDFVMENRLPQPTTVHCHGLTLPEAADGAGFTPILPGESGRVRFEVRNRAGLYWIHSHAHGFTAEQVHAGLAALLIVHDAEDDALDAALGLGSANRLALALADVREANGVLMPYAPAGGECLHGWYGNRMTVNTQLDARFVVAPGWVRLQILNACNARGLLFGFQDTARPVSPLLPFQLLGTDGGLLAAPRQLEHIFLYGAERIDIAIEAAAGASIQAVSMEFDPRHQVRGKWQQPMLHPGRANYPPLASVDICATGESGGKALADGARMPLFALRVSDRAATGTAALPQKLSALADAGIFNGTPTRRLRLDFDDQNGFLIDNQRYRIDETGYVVARGAREVWEIRNSPISMPHAMHLHGFAFRVLRRQGTFGPARALATETQGRLPTDLGLKDTVVIWPNETVWLAVDFSLPDGVAFRGPQRYMFHCHNLEHEDGMMMRNLTVT